MPRIQYKQKCVRCKKSYVLTTARNNFPLCYKCQKKDLEGEITDPKMKEMFDIPEEFYQENSFLRSIKINYLKFGKLSEKQIEAFNSAVKKMKNDA